MSEHQDACDAPQDCGSDTGQAEALYAAMLQARALCIQAALVTRREMSAPQDIIERAETYWGWVSQPVPARTTGQADPLTRRKGRRSTLG